MQTSTKDRKLILRISLDVLVLIVLVIPIVVFEVGIEPFNRGFFCDDESIKYPYKGNTISTTVLGLIVSIPTLVLILIGEYGYQYKSQISNGSQTFKSNVYTWMINCLQQIMYFCYGFLLTFDVTEVGKYTIGRLRPHFIAVCQPRLSDGTSCTDAVNQYRYIENYECKGTDFAAKLLRESRLSFPSGHSSLVFFAAIYMVIYLQKRTQWSISELIRPFVQSSLIMLAWFTALSRVMDNWHHWSDVLSGMLIGAIIASVTASFLIKRETFYTNFGSLRLSGLTRQDTSATLNEVLTTTPPPYTINQESENEFSNEQYCTKV